MRSTNGFAGFSASREVLNKSRHASCLHIFRLIARKLLEIHQVFLRHFHTITGGGFRYEKSVCAICIPDLISASLKRQRCAVRGARNAPDFVGRPVSAAASPQPPAASRHARRALPPYRLFTPRTPPVQPVMTAVRVLASASVP